MKPSHITTPRTLAECSFEVGYYTYSPISDKPTVTECIAYGTAAVIMCSGLLTLALHYFDILVK